MLKTHLVCRHTSFVPCINFKLADIHKMNQTFTYIPVESAASSPVNLQAPPSPSRPPARTIQDGTIASLRQAALGDHLFVRPLEDTGLPRLDLTTIPCLEDLYTSSNLSTLPSPRATTSPEGQSFELPDISMRDESTLTPDTSAGPSQIQPSLASPIDPTSLSHREDISMLPSSVRSYRPVEDSLSQL